MGLFNKNKSQAPAQRPTQKPVQPQRNTQFQNRQQPRAREGRQRKQAPQTAPEGIAQCEVSKIPSEFFWKGVVLMDLAFIRLLPQKERKARGYGQPDVEVRSALRGTYYMFRSDINSVCLDTDGKPIRANRLHSDKVYQVQIKLNPTQVAYLPPSSAGNKRKTQYTLSGEQLPVGKYLIFLVDTEGNVLYDKVYKLSRGYFNRMVQPMDTAKTVASRVKRWKSQVGMTTQQKYLSADFRIVAKVEDLASYMVTGFVLSFIKNGKMYEEAFAMQMVENLARQNRIRNMTPNFMLTYGSIRDLPTMFVDSRAIQ